MSKLTFKTPEERLIVALDLEVKSDDPHAEASEYLFRTCEILKPYAGRGLTLKINTLANLLGVTAIQFIHEQGFRCFLDLKFLEIQKTLLREVAWIRICKPEMITLSARVKPRAFQSVIQLLPDTLVLAVDPLTDLGDEDYVELDEQSRAAYIEKYFRRIWRWKTEGTICHARDLRQAPLGLHKSAVFITPDITPSWSLTSTDTSDRWTLRDAITAGANAVVVGGRITNEPDIRRAVGQTLEEIAACL